MIALSGGIKISAEHRLVLSQYTHLTQTERQTDGQKCDSKTVCSITCSHTVRTCHFSAWWHSFTCLGRACIV